MHIQVFTNITTTNKHMSISVHITGFQTGLGQTGFPQRGHELPICL